MKINSFLIYFILFKVVNGKSFTVVLDTTVSMQNEIDVIKANIASLADIMKNLPDFEDFIVVPFKDQDIGEPIITTDPHNLRGIFNSITAIGGNDCPEDSLAGLKKALEVSKANSFVYVFTDAYAKDISRFKDIEKLCKNTDSRVVIFLSGGCPGSDYRTLGYVDVYYDIAKSCSGAVFKFDSVNLRKAFNYMKEMIKTDWNDIINHEPFSGYKEFNINIDAFTTDFLIAISGNYPTLQLVDADDSSPEKQKIVDTPQSLVVRVKYIRAGSYKASIRCQGLASLTFYMKSRFPYQYGFSTRLPNSLAETSLRPMPGRVNYMLIVIPQDFNFKVTSMEMQPTDGSDRKLLSVAESQIHSGFYATSVFVEPSGSFKILIHGIDPSYQESTMTTKGIDPQVPVTNTVWSKPVVEILDMDSNLIYYATNATIVCKVKGYPKPEIVWENDEGTTLKTEELLLEVPSVYLSYVTINATSNHTFYCKAKNKEGSDKKAIELYVNRTYAFDIVQSPQNATFEYGSEGKLYCEVNAYPEANLKWTHNDTSVEYSDNIEIVENENALVIKNMTLNDAGVYECTVTNEVRTETLRAEVSISGLEAPELEIESSEIDLKPGDWINIECRVVRGNPVPVVTWEYQSPTGNDFESVPSDVYADGTELKISAVKKDHKGTYKCTAVNLMGEDSKQVVVNIKYAPIISATEDNTIRVIEGRKVVLPCEVDATPEATVRWVTAQESADDRYNVDDRHTLRFNALWKDSGYYRCTAENEVGKTQKIINLEVLVPPFIQPTESRVMTIAHGHNVTLTCNVLYGNPAPSTKWEFIATDSTASVLTRGNSETLYLNLINVSRANEGMYLCIAENEVGNDRIRIDLKVN